MSTYNVHVSGLAPTTTETQLHDFFTFCGKISSIDFNADDKSAIIHFEKPSAAKTALMLNDGHLDGVDIIVTSDVEHPDVDPAADDSAPIDQSDKPRAGIAAEYLARGYKLSDGILQRAIEMDNRQGISKRFLNYFHQFDTTVGARALGPDRTLSGKVQATFSSAANQARSVDEQKGYSKTAHEYYSKAISSPFGQKVFSFYTSTSKQVRDIHEEARRIADQHKTAGGAPAQSADAPAAT
jgi:RNA recognition motif-containing protein